jgi:hypothetical protein
MFGATVTVIPRIDACRDFMCHTCQAGRSTDVDEQQVTPVISVTGWVTLPQ